MTLHPKIIACINSCKTFQQVLTCFNFHRILHDCKAKETLIELINQKLKSL